jgi:hypothetical protein
MYVKVLNHAMPIREMATSPEGQTSEGPSEYYLKGALVRLLAGGHG